MTIIPFPKERIVNWHGNKPKELISEELALKYEENIQAFTQDLVNKVEACMVEHIPKKFQGAIPFRKDLAFVRESVRSAVYRIYKKEHVFQEYADKIEIKYKSKVIKPQETGPDIS